MRRAWLALCLLALPSVAHAHGYEIGVLALHELEPGRFAIAWRPPEDTRRTRPVRVSIRYPEHCLREHHELRCEGGLHGVIAFDDFPDARTPIVVRVERLDGRRVDAVVRQDAPTLRLARANGTLAALEQGAARVFRLEHLALLAALVLVVGVRRRAIPALFALVFGHAIGLGLASGAGLPAAPLMATSAVGVLLLARAGARESADRAWVPLALLAALAQGLTAGEAAPAMSVLGAVLADLLALAVLAGAARSLPAISPRTRVSAAYALGALGGFWLITHTAAILVP